MAEKQRITLQFQKSQDGAVHGVDIFLNPAGVALLIERLKSLSESNDHFHLFSPEWESDGELSTIPYDKDESVGEHLKVHFRPDKWDREYYPHLFVDGETDEKA